MLVHAAHRNLYSAGQQAIIGVEKKEKFTPAMSYSGVAGTGKAGVFLMNMLRRGIALCDFRSVPRRAVAHQDDVDLRITLRQHAFDRLAQKLRLVEAGDNYR